MKHYIIVATAMAALVACKGEAGSEETAAKKEPTLMLQTEDQKASYAIGMKFGEGMGRDYFAAVLLIGLLLYWMLLLCVCGGGRGEGIACHMARVRARYLLSQIPRIDHILCDP